jgi:hypothetical protein
MTAREQLRQSSMPTVHHIHLVQKLAIASALGKKLQYGGGEAEFFHEFITFLNSQAFKQFIRLSQVVLHGLQLNLSAYPHPTKAHALGMQRYV